MFNYAWYSNYKTKYMHRASLWQIMKYNLLILNNAFIIYISLIALSLSPPPGHFCHASSLFGFFKNIFLRSVKNIFIFDFLS